MALKNELSWSNSKARWLHECPRAYYFDRYGSWGGWDAHASERARLLYRLKHLQNVGGWIGRRLHSAIELVLRDISAEATRKTFDAPKWQQRLTARTLDEMRDELRLSASHEYRRDPKRILGLHTHESGGTVTPAHWEDIALDVRSMIETFFRSQWLEMLLALPPASFVEIEKLAEIQHKGIKVYLALDLLLMATEERELLVDGMRPLALVLDWKTGRRDVGNREQMALYSAYVGRVHSLDPHEIVASCYSLRLASDRHYAISTAEVEGVWERIEGDVEIMRNYIVDRDVDRNEPLPEPEFTLAADNRPCKICSFTTVCERWAKKTTV